MPASPQPPKSPDDAEGSGRRRSRAAPIPGEVRVQRAVPWEEEEEGRVVLLVARFGKGRLGRLLSKVLRKGPIRVRLDEMGSRAWRLFESGRTVQDVAEALAEEGETQLEARLDSFLRQLHRSGCIILEESCE